jgi:hypothetical protein
MIVNFRCKRPNLVKNTSTGVVTPGEPTVVWERFQSIFPVSAELQERDVDVDIYRRFRGYWRDPSLDIREGDKLFELVNDEESGSVYTVIGVQNWITTLAVELERIDE